MENNIPSQDISFQPETKGYSFANKEFEVSQKKEKTKSIFTAIFGLIMFLVIFILFLVGLNYFNIISLSSIKNVFQPEKKSKLISYNKISGTWFLEGSLYAVKSNSIQIKYDESIKNLDTTWNNTYTILTINKTKKTASASAYTTLQTYLISNLNSNNIGKRVTAEFITKNNANKLINLFLYQ